MKKVILLLTVFAAAMHVQAQSDKYVKAMQPKIIAIDTTHNTDLLLELANGFERIGDAEKTQWLPYYYAALAHINAGNMMAFGKGSMGGNAEITDPEADKADALLAKAEKLTTENSEIWILKKMIATLRMMGDPMNRYMQYGPAAATALENAKKLDPSNPRVYLLEGQDKFFTPEQFGGSKTEAKKLFETALVKYDSFKVTSDLQPAWGKPATQYFLAQAK